MVKKWTDYNRKLAQESKLVAHGMIDGPSNTARRSFFRANKLDEVAQEIANGVSSPYVVCGQILGKPVGALGALRKKIRTTMMFFAHADQSYDSQEDARQLAYDAMVDFITRYNEDFEATGTCGPFNVLHPSRMSFQEIGPVTIWDFGWRLDIEFIADGKDLVFDPSKWQTP